MSEIIEIASEPGCPPIDSFALSAALALVVMQSSAPNRQSAMLLGAIIDNSALAVDLVVR